MSEGTSGFPERLRRIRMRIREAAERSGRSAGEICLVGASKQVPVDLLRAAFAEGLYRFGENRVQEAGPKIEALGAGIEWHFIGHLQRNKVKAVVGRFELIHSLDGLELARAIHRRCEGLGTRQRVLIEVNVSGEARKEGIPPDAVEGFLSELRELRHLKVEGFMTVPPYSNDPESPRPIFRALRECRDRMRETSGMDLRELSMGMSNDFEVAVEEGATYVRIGTALFGERPPVR